MSIEIPSAEQVRAALEPLNLKQLDALAALSGVPASTIYKIKRGETSNPGLETLRQFMPHVDAARQAGLTARSTPAPADHSRRRAYEQPQPSPAADGEGA